MSPGSPIARAAQSVSEEPAQVVYAFVRQFIHEQGYPPSLRQIADQCGLGMGAVVRHLNRLEAQGRIVRARGQSRSIRLVFATSKARPLTNPVTEAVYVFIRDYIGQRGYSPSIREIARDIQLGKTTVMRQLDMLKAQGRVASVPGRARTLRILK